uniref:Helix-turn-helix DNA binding domain protein n=1 Tax=Mycobacterium phage Naji TaxID=2599872 RepID=A0A5J6TJ02_BPMD2|nr:helix-turn-helix DNA binding domain protein [Mycobacterium phage Naji]
MRKKHLREANTKLARDLGVAKVELAQEIQKNEDLTSANGRLVTAVNRQVAVNQNLRSENADLRSQLDTARRTFGEAFVKGSLAPVGPNRPNRQKLTEREVRDIREAYRGGMKQKDLADNYGVNPATISRTVRGIYH